MMSPQLIQSVKGLGAARVLTAMHAFLTMGLAVLREIRRLGELLAALLTLQGLVSRVGTLVDGYRNRLVFQWIIYI